jgi:aryl-phospho-beta-D-glucosidase BglC (GH1 family)
MFSPHLTLATALLGLSLLPSVFGITPGFPYGTKKVRGVNLGGWLLLESWITPSLFDATNNSKIVDEYTFGQLQPKAAAQAALKKHWDTFITEADFIAIAAAGLNHIRLPVGYWAFDVGPGEPFISGQIPYIQKAVTWAAKHGLKIILDLHGVPGSQNGFDNSGQRLKNGPTWQSNQTDIKRSNNVIKAMANMFKDNSTTVPIIAPLNEPAGFYSGVVAATKQFWLDSYGSIRYPYGTSKQSNTVELIHDAFQGLPFWKGFMTPSQGYQGVAMDIHHYQIFVGDQNAWSDQQHIDTACGYGSELSTFDLWIMVGEWAPVKNDCAKNINGRGIGSRYDGSYPGSTRVGSCVGLTGNASTFSASYKTFLRKFWEAQVHSYEMGQGWLQWTWKAENADEWTYQAGLANGWIPQDPTSRMYPTICG